MPSVEGILFYGAPMKWYKHMTNAMDDLFVKDLERKFGDTGYAFWFKTLELIGNHGDAGKLTISWSNYLEKLHKRRTQVELLLDFCSTASKLAVTISKQELTIECRKFAEYSDNYTKYGKALQSDLKESTKQEEEREEEKEVEVEKKKKEKKFCAIIPPMNESVVEYFQSHNSTETEAQKFMRHYESNGWHVGKNKMCNWHSAASGWILRAKEYSNGTSRQNNGSDKAGYRVPPPAGKYDGIGKTT